MTGRSERGKLPRVTADCRLQTADCPLALSGRRRKVRYDTARPVALYAALVRRIGLPQLELRLPVRACVRAPTPINAAIGTASSGVAPIHSHLQLLG